MLDIVKKLLGLVPGGGALGVVSNVATIGAVIAAIAGPLAVVFNERDTVFITVTVGELAFWSFIISVIVWVALIVARRAPSP